MASNPLALNLKILGVLGMWDLPDFKKWPFLNWIYFFFLRLMTLNVIIVTISGIIGMVIAIREWSEIMIPIISHFTMEIMLLTNYFYLSMHKNKINNLMDLLKKCLDKAEKTGVGYLENFAPWKKNAGKITKIWMCFLIYVGLHWTLVPVINHLVLSEPAHSLYYGWYPVDKNKEPTFEIIYIMEALATMFYVYIFGSVDVFVISILILISGLLEHLSKCASSMYPSSNDLSSENCIEKKKAVREYTQCFRLHQEIIRSVTEQTVDQIWSYESKSACLKRLAEYIFLFYFRFYIQFLELASPMLFFQTIRVACALSSLFILAVTLKSDDAHVLVYFEYGSLYTVEFFLYTWYATEITRLGLKVADETYLSNWTESDTSFRKCVCLMINRSQNPMLITGGPFFVINLELLIAVYRLSFSIYTILKQVHEEEPNNN